jgi:hypothetical protein
MTHCRVPPGEGGADAGIGDREGLPVSLGTTLVDPGTLGQIVGWGADDVGHDVGEVAPAGRVPPRDTTHRGGPGDGLPAGDGYPPLPLGHRVAADGLDVTDIWGASFGRAA